MLTLHVNFFIATQQISIDLIQDQGYDAEALQVVLGKSPFAIFQFPVEADIASLLSVLLNHFNFLLLFGLFACV